jgi:hypothetical protein
LECSSSRRSDEADPARERRQRALAGRIEQALGLKPKPKFLELGRQESNAFRSNEVEDELEFAPLRIHGDSPMSDDPFSVFQLKSRHVVAEKNGSQRSAGVFERKVPVPRLRSRVIRNLSLDPEVAEEFVRFENFPEEGDNSRD